MEEQEQEQNPFDNYKHGNFYNEWTIIACCVAFVSLLWLIISLTHDYPSWASVLLGGLVGAVFTHLIQKYITQKTLLDPMKIRYNKLYNELKDFQVSNKLQQGVVDKS